MSKYSRYLAARLNPALISLRGASTQPPALLGFSNFTNAY